MPRVHTQKAGKDYPDIGVKKGETYYWWKFRYGGKRMSKTYPKRQQLTQSAFLGSVYDIEDAISELTAETPEDLELAVESIVGDLENLKDETQSNLDNIQDHLQESHINTRRIEALDEMIDELNGITVNDYDEPDRDEIRSELEQEDDDPDADPSDKEIDDRIESKLRDWIEEKLQEIQAVSYNGE
jgi:hypothetical protein